MSAALAALPIATALALLILRAGPFRAALAAVICGLFVALFGFTAQPRVLAGVQLAMAPVALEGGAYTPWGPDPCQADE